MTQGSAPPPSPVSASGPAASSGGAAGAPAPPSPGPGASVAAGSRQRRRGLLLLALAAAAAVGWGFVNLQRELAQAQRGLAELAEEAAAQRAQTEERLRQAQQRIAVLEQDVAAVRAQRALMDEMMLDLTRGRDDLALLEVDRLLTLAAQELQITGHVPTALAALQSADLRLARVQRPQWLNLRRAIARDIERLRGLPAVDVAGLALKIDQLVQGVDGWPLLAEPPAARPPAAKAPAAAVRPAPEPPEPGLWDRIRAWLGAEFGELVSLRRIDTPEALLLSPQQQQLVRLQVKLRLLNARQAMLMRNERLYRADLAEAQSLLARYFDVRDPALATPLGALKQLIATPLAAEAPSIADSLAAVRAARGDVLR